MMCPGPSGTNCYHGISVDRPHEHTTGVQERTKTRKVNFYRLDTSWKVFYGILIIKRSSSSRRVMKNLYIMGVEVLGREIKSRSIF